METLYIVMPAYNEEENIQAVVDGWYPLLKGKSGDSRLVIADSGSTDRTHAILEELRKTSCPDLEIISGTSRYHGPKLIALYQYAIDKGADYIFQTDSDGQTDPQEFEAFWRERGDYDGIFGNRTARGDGRFRAFVEHFTGILLRLYFGVRIPDANAPFRLMKAETVSKYLNRLPTDYAIPNIMLTAFFAYYKEKISFNRITFGSRKAGVNSMNIPVIIKTGWKALGDFSRFRKMMKQSEKTIRKHAGEGA